MIFKDFVYYIAVVKDDPSNYKFVLITLQQHLNKIFENYLSKYFKLLYF